MAGALREAEAPGIVGVLAGGFLRSAPATRPIFKKALALQGEGANAPHLLTLLQSRLPCNLVYLFWSLHVWSVCAAVSNWSS